MVLFSDLYAGVYPHFRTIASYQQDDGFGNIINTEWKCNCIFNYNHFVQQDH